MTDFQEIMVNGRWPLRMLPHRAARPEWPTWEQERLSLTYEIVTDAENAVVWEVGAEEGDFPALYATWGARVVLIEPNPYVWPQIRLHWEANTDIDPLACIVGLASDENMTADTDYDPQMRGVWPEVAYGEVIPAHGFRHIWEHSSVSPQYRLDELGLPAPDLVTMDIEGGEWKALRGMTGTFARHHPDVIVSIHPEFLQILYQKTREDVLAVMNDAGYIGDCVAVDHEEHWWFRPV